MPAPALTGWVDAINAIDREIASHEDALRRLHDNRRREVRGRIGGIASEFDAGMRIAEIAAAWGQTPAAIRAIVWRAGRTVGGRTAIKARLREIGADRAKLHHDNGGR